MKKKLKTIINIVILIAIGIWIIDKIPFNKNINQQVIANVYKNDVVAEQTTIVINGKKSNYLFRKEEGFVGEFLIPYAEKTDRSDLQTYISWNDIDNTQRIIYSYKGGFRFAEDMEIVSTILINDSMTKFAIMLTDNTIIATSDELRELYDKHITWHNDIPGISIVKANEIPKID